MEVVVNQHVLSVDNRLIYTEGLFSNVLKREGLNWLQDGENADYLSNVFVRISPKELEAFKKVAMELTDLGIIVAKKIAANDWWEEAGIPENAIEVVRYSLKYELEMHLLNRFDFAGGIDGLPIKLIEFNADTCSLMPETTIVQEEHWIQEQYKLADRPYNDLVVSLTEHFKKIIRLNPKKDKTLLISTLDFEEDLLNVEVVLKAAKKAGFEDVQMMPLDKIIFAPDEGIFIELNQENYRRYDFFYKFIPWEFIAYEEPELMDILSDIVVNELAIVLNPAFTMLLQSKAICKFMYDHEPNNPHLLKTSFDASDFPDKKYVKKPIFGRMGENIAYYDGGNEPEYQTEGDYEDFDMVYQELADFNEDRKEHRYQPSIFYTNEPCGMAIRRQDDLIIDDDAEFVGHTIARQ